MGYKVGRISLLSDFSRKYPCSYAHILSRKRPFSKKHTFLMPIFCPKKCPFSQKQCAFMLFFFKFLWKTSCCHVHIWSKETSILSNLHYIIGQKSKKDALFSIFTKKPFLPCPYDKNVHSLKNKLFSCSYFIKNTPTLSKTRCPHVIFLNFH